MVKTSELRLGNLFMVPAHKNMIASVVEIRADYVVCKGGNLTFLLASVEPIPLTTESVERLGFTFLDGTWLTLGDCLKKQHDLLTFKVFPHFKIVDIKCGNAGQARIQKIKYVHQLQNMYFSLTGEELKLSQP